MNKIEPTPNSDGKFEFQFDKSIGQKINHIDPLIYKYAKKQLKGFIETFGIKDEPVVIEADILTFTRLIADLLVDYRKLVEGEWTHSK